MGILRNITFGQNDRYKINWHSDKTFSLVSLDREIDTVSSVEKSLNSLGKPYYEITDCKDGTFDFVYRRNHHIGPRERARSPLGAAWGRRGRGRGQGQPPRTTTDR